MQMNQSSSDQKPVKRVGMVIELRPDRLDEYRRLHADDNPGIRDLTEKYHMRNFSIFLQEIDSRWYEFGYYEYTGDNFDADMAELAKEPRNVAWLNVCDAMQIPLPGASSWTDMERVFYNS
jgi:L-rhamnose mutarotase